MLLYLNSRCIWAILKNFEQLSMENFNANILRTMEKRKAIKKNHIALSGNVFLVDNWNSWKKRDDEALMLDQLMLELPRAIPSDVDKEKRKNACIIIALSTTTDTSRHRHLLSVHFVFRRVIEPQETLCLESPGQLTPRTDRFKTSKSNRNSIEGKRIKSRSSTEWNRKTEAERKRWCFSLARSLVRSLVVFTLFFVSVVRYFMFIYFLLFLFGRM